MSSENSAIAANAAPDSALDALSPRERRFVLEYVADPKRNGTAAALRAGYEAGADNASAAVAAARLLRRDKVLAAVRELEGRLGGPDLLPRLVAKLEAIAFCDLTDLMSWDAAGRVSFVPSDRLSPRAAAAVAEIQDLAEEEGPRRLPGLEEDPETVVSKIRRKVKLHDPLKAIDALAKLKGFYAPEKLELSGDLKERLERGLARVAG